MPHDHHNEHYDPRDPPPPERVELVDTALDLSAFMLARIADHFGLEHPNGIARHDVQACPVVGCEACGALLCAEDALAHLSPEGCGWAQCGALADHVGAINAARRAANIARRAARLVADSPPPATDVGATKAPASGAAPFSPVQLAQFSAVLALHQVRPFLLGLQGGASLADREISGLAAVLALVEMAITADNERAALEAS